MMITMAMAMVMIMVAMMMTMKMTDDSDTENSSTLLSLKDDSDENEMPEQESYDTHHLTAQNRIPVHFKDEGLKGSRPHQKRRPAL